MNKVTIDLNVLGEFMKDQIGSDMESRLIVVIQVHWLIMKYSKVTKESLELNKPTS